ncbi:hypothetical protein QJS10_CPA06g02034 [Acorus calamus]|uniref:RNase H type-1 domain-containing protein n=1 Tax=Acorus calamus TaxID=4465 RepID=A0AAV9EP39_ACOCL|nr:hypothetical protein QJS10_CPA06g02034 [Acorus calamus]
MATHSQRQSSGTKAGSSLPTEQTTDGKDENFTQVRAKKAAKKGVSQQATPKPIEDGSKALNETSRVAKLVLKSSVPPNKLDPPITPRWPLEVLRTRVLLHSRSWKNGKEKACIKIDLRKAFDSVRWGASLNKSSMTDPQWQLEKTISDGPRLRTVFGTSSTKCLLCFSCYIWKAIATKLDLRRPPSSPISQWQQWLDNLHLQEGKLKLMQAFLATCIMLIWKERCMRIYQASCVNHLELQGKQAGLQLKLGFSWVMFQTDSKIIEAWLKGKGHFTWRSKRVFYEIQDDLSMLDQWPIHHIHREANQAADILASKEQTLGHNSQPPSPQQCLAKP